MTCFKNFDFLGLNSRSYNKKRTGSTIVIVILVGFFLFTCYFGGLTVSFKIKDATFAIEPPLLQVNALLKSTELRVYGKPATRLGFLKMEKASSSTISGIFFRFGIRYNLTFALPCTGVVLRPMNVTVTKNNDGRFDILAVHVSTKDMYDWLLHDDHIQLAVVRHPLKRMISAAYFYRQHAIIKDKDFIHKLINKPELFEEKTVFTRTRNAMGKTFGFSTSTRKNDTKAIKKQLDLLNKQFSLVLVTERLEESLVLMKRMLNWTFNDIIYISKNIHPHEKVTVSQKEEEKYKDSSFLDYAIYDYFKDILNQKIISEGDGFKDEVECYKDVLKKVTTFCERKKLSRLIIERSKWNERFKLPRDDCKLMAKANPLIIAGLRNQIRNRKQYQICYNREGLRKVIPAKVH